MYLYGIERRLARTETNIAYRLNCTFMELKGDSSSLSNTIAFTGLNCTFMELKDLRKSVKELQEYGLIVPLWN